MSWPMKKFLKKANMTGIKAGAVSIHGGHPWRTEKKFKKLVEKAGGIFIGFEGFEESEDKKTDNKIAVERAKNLLSE